MTAESPTGRTGAKAEVRPVAYIDENRRMSCAWAIVRLSRPHFLLGGATMYAIGAVSVGVTSVRAYLLGQALVTSAQITAHYVNEHADREADRGVINRTLFSGGSGVLGEGDVSPQLAWRAAQATSAATLVLAGAVAARSVAAAVFGLLALSVSWAYSAPPIRLLDRGWGELATSAVVAVLVPAMGALINGGGVSNELLWTVSVLFLIHMAMMLAFELPDLDSDRTAGKTVIAVRVGQRGTIRLMEALFLLAATAALAGERLGRLDAGWPMVVAALLAIITLWSAHQLRYRVLTAAAVATFMAFGAGTLI